VQRVAEHFIEHPTSSARASLQLSIRRTSLQRINDEQLKIFPYKIQIQHLLQEADLNRRMQFAQQLIPMLESGEIAMSEIWYTDEAHFHLHGYVNKQNYGHWGTENPHLVVAKPLHPQKCTVWCAISAGGIVGPFFIQTTVTAADYIDILREKFIPFAQGVDMVQNCWFQQDGARPHRTLSVFELLEEHFHNRIIGLDSKKYTGGGVEWPAYSPDLNPCDYFLWGYLKDRVYRSAPTTIDQFKNNIKTEINAIGSEVHNRVIDNFLVRLCHLVNVVEWRPLLKPY